MVSNPNTVDDSRAFADAVKQVANGLLTSLYNSKTDLVIATMSLHLAYTAALHLLNRSDIPKSKVIPLLSALLEEDVIELHSILGDIKADNHVGIM